MHVLREENMRIAITGASGFIGSEFRKNLIPDWDIVALSRTEKEGFWETDYSVESLTRAFDNVDIVIHLASIRGKAEEYSAFTKNEILIENILKAMLACRCKRIIFMSSLAVYSDQKRVPWSEEQCVCPQTFYGLSKLAGEYLCQLYASKGITYTILRCGIVYGLDHTKRMISNFIDQAYRKEMLCLTGKSVNKRDFVYVKEVVKVLNWAVQTSDLDNQIINLSSGEAYTNLEIAEAVNECFDNVGNLKYDDTAPENIINSYMSADKLRELGFKHDYSLKSALIDIKEGIQGENI